MFSDYVAYMVVKFSCRNEKHVHFLKCIGVFKDIQLLICFNSKITMYNFGAFYLTFQLMENSPIEIESLNYLNSLINGIWFLCIRVSEDI